MTGSSSATPTQSGTKTYPEASDETVSAQPHARADRSHPDPLRARIEPSIGDPGIPGASSAYEKLHGLGPDFGGGEYHRPARSRLSRVAMMASVFIVGASVGLGAAWWFHKPSTGAPVTAVPSSPARTMPAANAKRHAAVRGISPSELPYDGVPPSPQDSEEPPTAKLPPAVAPRTTDATPPADTSSGVSAAAIAGDSNSGAGEVGRDEAAAPQTLPKEERKPEVTDTPEADEPKSAKTVKKGAASVASAAPKRKSATRSDREIERIRRQVDEELKKKTEHSRAMNERQPGARQGARNDDGSRRNVSSAAPTTRMTAIRASLAKCDRNTNFIRREFCRWQICNGSWGSNGCPSYQKQASNY